MQKLIEIIKKKDIDISIIICIIVAESAFFLKLNFYDELWNFANAYKMFEGYKIYRDLNVIITPLFFYISQIFLKILGTNILSFKIYNFFISSMLLIIVYKIFKSLRIIKRRSIIYTLLIAFMLASIVKAGGNYNVMVLLPILINILLIIKKKENDILTGILLFLTFMLKQNVFVYFGIGILIYKISTIEDVKKTVISLVKIYLTSIVFIGIFIIYLHLDNNLYNFINYCFLGIKEFESKNMFGDLLSAKYIWISMIGVIFLFFIIKNKKTKKNLEQETIKNIEMFLSIGIPLVAIAYPIFNYYHATIASVVLVIGVIYTIEETLIKELTLNSKHEKIIYNAILIICMLYSMYSIVYMLNVLNNDKYYFDKSHPFYGYIVNEEDLKDVEIICNYIKENRKKGIDVKILSYKANLYMVPLGINNGEMDLPNLGNFGKNGEDGLIDNIKELKNAVILIQTHVDKDIIGQESKKVREYIIQNYKKIGVIQEYSIYKMS